MSEENALIVRTADVIAGEIVSIKTETFRFLEAATNYATRQTFEIGKRLIEAKQLVDAGKWVAWLHESVDYSEDTAQNLMRIYREYDSGNPLVRSMSYSQLVALFPISAEKREEFAEENNVPSLSVKDIKKLIKDKEVAEKKLLKSEESIKKLEGKLSKSEESYKKLEDKLNDTEKMADRDKLASMKLIDEKKALEKELKELRDAPPKIEKVVETVPGEVTEEQLNSIRDQVRGEYESLIKKQETDELRQDPLMVEINVRFNQLQKEIRSISDVIDKLPSDKVVNIRSVIGRALSDLTKKSFGL